MKKTEAIDHTKVVLDGYARAVEVMRDAQESYFRTRDPHYLTLSKAREKQVDEMTDIILNPPTRLQHSKTIREMIYKKEPVKGNIQLGLYPVYCDSIYGGREPMKVVGIRERLIELEGDYSGGTHNTYQKDWFNTENCFVVRKICPEQLKPNGCQTHNVNCCGGGNIITEHTEYWK